MIIVARSRVLSRIPRWSRGKNMRRPQWLDGAAAHGIAVWCQDRSALDGAGGSYNPAVPGNGTFEPQSTRTDESQRTSTVERRSEIPRRYISVRDHEPRQGSCASADTASRGRFVTKPRHVFIGLKEIAGYYGNLAAGIRELDVRVTFVDLSGNRYGYDNDLQNPRWIAAIESLMRRMRPRNPRAMSVRKIIWSLAQRILKIPISAWAIFRCDVFIFGYRSHFARHFELYLIQLLGKRSVFIFNGSDSRPPYLSGSYVTQDGPIDGRRLAKLTKRMKTSIHRIERWAHVLINHPPSAHLHDRAFVPWLWIGIPTRLPDHPPHARIPGPVRIVGSSGKGYSTHSRSR